MCRRPGRPMGTGFTATRQGAREHADLHIPDSPVRPGRPHRHFGPDGRMEVGSLHALTPVWVMSRPGPCLRYLSTSNGCGPVVNVKSSIAEGISQNEAHPG